MKPIQIISQDLFDKIRSRFANLEMGDETGAVTIDPAEARFFDFDFVSEDVNLGRVSISLNDLGSLKIYYSQGITENQDDAATRTWYNFLKEMRFFAMRRLLRFDTRDIAKDNLDRNDFQYLAAKAPKEEETMNMNESRWSQKSSRKTSRAVNGSTEVIVRHAKPVEETYPGARSQRKNIKAIFIQNRDGERFKYPFIHPAGAFAMAQHVDHGGVPHDSAGKAIIRMSEQIAQLQEFQRQIRPASLHDDALGITERAMAKLNELKSCIENLSKRKYYESWLAEFNETDEPILGELDAVTMETYKQKFTQSTFNENLAELFPLIHSIMQETNTVDLEEYVSEGEGEHVVHCSQCGGEFHSDKTTGFSHCKDHAGMKNYDVDEAVDDFARFESWVEAVEQGKLTDDQIEELKSALADLEASGQKLELGPDGQTAWEFFSSFGLEDSDLEDKLKSMADVDPETDPMQVLQAWAKDSYPELLVALGMSGTAEPQPEAEPQAAEPQPEEQPVAEGQGPGEIIREVAKIVKSFYNRDNPNVGPFRGEEGIALDVEKKISEKFGEQVGQHARSLAEKFMEKLTHEWSQRHGETLTGEGNIEEGSSWMHDPSLPPGLYVMPDGADKPIGPVYTADGKGPLKNPGDLARHNPKLAQMVRMGRAESFYISPEFAAANKQQGVAEGQRLIGKKDFENRSIKIYKDTEWGEYIVKLYVDGNYQPDADYHTDDKEDAIGTAQHMLSGQQGVAEGSEEIASILKLAGLKK